MIAESAAASAMLAFALGNRHGLDADHLAAIDGLTRLSYSLATLYQAELLAMQVLTDSPTERNPASDDNFDGR